mgnify:CR=1 FL=1
MLVAKILLGIVGYDFQQSRLGRVSGALIAVGDTYREKKLTLVTVGSRSFLKLERVDLESVAYRKLFQAGGDSAGNDAYDRGWIDSGHLFDSVMM